MSHYLSPGDYLPHDAPMLLLEEVVSVREDTAVLSRHGDERRRSYTRSLIRRAIYPAGSRWN